MSLDEPGAMERYRAANDNYDRLVALATKAANEVYDELDAPTTAYLAETFYIQTLELDDQRRWVRDESWEFRWKIKTEETLDGLMPIYRHFQANGDLDGLLDFWGEEAGCIAEAGGYRLDDNGEPLIRLCRALNEAAIRAGEVRRQRLSGDLLPTPAPPVQPALVVRVEPHAKSFAELVEEELERPSFTAGHSTKEATRTALRLWVELHGASTPESITRAQVSEYIDALVECPVVRGKERALPIKDLIDRYAGREGPRLSEKTQATHLGALNAIWNKLQRAGRIDEAKANPFANHKLAKSKPKRGQSDFSREEVNAILALPVFTNGERPIRGKGEASFWIPLLLLTTGARPEEIAQLLVADVGGQANGQWTLSVTDEGDHPHKGPRRLKNDNSHRTFPLPEILVDLGFLDYVSWLKQRGEIALFPALRTKSKRGLLFAGFGDWWGEYLRHHNAYPEGRKGGRDFRHTWTTLARRCRLPKDAREYIQGHRRGQSMNDDYGDETPLGEWMTKMDFGCWCLDGVRRWTPCVDGAAREQERQLTA